MVRTARRMKLEGVTLPCCSKCVSLMPDGLLRTSTAVDIIVHDPPRPRACHRQIAVNYTDDRTVRACRPPSQIDPAVVVKGARACPHQRTHFFRKRQCRVVRRAKDALNLRVSAPSVATVPRKQNVRMFRTIAARGALGSLDVHGSRLRPRAHARGGLHGVRTRRRGAFGYKDASAHAGVLPTLSSLLHFPSLVVRSRRPFPSFRASS
ncbi:hypothetical protein C8Q77DRAFT_637697 [Trametes polyzona]|nr:hypothetical protein C8Q77DRAFT_637697 [Trametes polyzona]